MLKLKALLGLCLLLFALQSSAQTPSPVATTPSLKILTFNTWLLELYDVTIASHLIDRRDLMAQDLRASGADVLNLIEVWEPKNADYLVEQLRDVYPYCSFDPDKTRDKANYANGLLVFSKWPLKTDGFHYANGCTRPLQAIIYSQITRIDEHFVSKGAIHNVLLHPQFGPLDLFSTHLGALTFSKKTNDYVLAHKQKVFAQSQDLMAFVDHVSETPTQFLMMDSNRNFRTWQAHTGYSEVLDPTYALILSEHFDDSFMAANQLDPRTLSDLYTFDVKRNPNAGGGAFVSAPSEFIDYVFVRSQKVAPTHSEMTFTTPETAQDGASVFLSDHFGIFSTFGVTPTMALSAP